MRLNPTPRLLYLAVGAAVLCAGCGESRRNEFLWQLGVILFSAYLLVVTITTGVAAMHQQAWFQRAARAVETPVALLALGIMAVGAGTFVRGLGRLGEPFGPRKLLFLFGFIITVMGVNMFLWAVTDSPTEKALRAKLVALSISFGIGMLYIMRGAALIRGG